MRFRLVFHFLGDVTGDSDYLPRLLRWGNVMMFFLWCRSFSSDDGGTMLHDKSNPFRVEPSFMSIVASRFHVYGRSSLRVFRKAVLPKMGSSLEACSEQNTAITKKIKSSPSHTLLAPLETLRPKTHKHLPNKFPRISILLKT